MAVETKGLVRSRGAREPPVAADGSASASLLLIALAAPFYLYPVLLMTALCFALFACAFNLLIGFVGLLSFGHAAFFGGAAYVTAHAAKVWGLTPELAILLGTAAAAFLGLVFGWLDDPPPGHLFRDDHPGARADDLLHRAPGAVHPWRGRHSGRAARRICSG